MSAKTTSSACFAGPPRRPIRQVRLCRSGSRRSLVLQVLASLSGGWAQRPLRSDPRQPPCRPTHLARVGEDHPLHPPASAGPRHASHTLQPDRSHRHPERIENLGHPTPPQRTHHRARSGTQRPDGPAGASGPSAATPRVSRFLSRCAPDRSAPPRLKSASSCNPSWTNCSPQPGSCLPTSMRHQWVAAVGCG
jgi:hypothetical protein